MTSDLVFFDKMPSTWEKIAEYVAPSDVTNIDFTGLDINEDGFYVLFFHVKNPAGANAALYLFVEGDYTATNYYCQYLRGDGTTVSGNRVNNPTIGYVFSGETVNGIVYIYRDVDGYFRYLTLFSYKPAASIRVEIRAGAKTAPVSNITQLRVHATVAGAIGEGSRFILCRVRTK